ncbi:Na/Pi symporter [bacterium]|nr:Na/Pi symporter [bacterium]
MLEPGIETKPSNNTMIYEFLKIIVYVYCFLLSIDLMGVGFKASSAGFISALRHATSNPFIGLVLGIFITSIIQSSSTTTSIIVAMVGAGTLSLESAIPVIMGANIGTTVTNTIVSFGYVGRKIEFERAFRASIVHDMFNIYATIILFPLELYTGILRRSALLLTGAFRGAGGFELVSPLKIILDPAVSIVTGIIHNHIVLIIVSLVFLFVSLAQIVKSMHGMIMNKVDRFLNRYLFRNALSSMLFGLILTAIIQSSSITTSIIVPIAGAGVLTLEQIFPYTLGANVGTTVTAILAALALGIEASMTVAFAHMLFNIFGIMIIYPFRIVPLWTAKTIARFAAKSKKHFLIFLIIYISLHILPVIITFF